MKIRVGVFFGGQSVEHDISIITASQAIAAIDRDVYEVVPVYIDKTFNWYTGEALFDVMNFKNIPALKKASTRVSLQNKDGKYVLAGSKKGLFSKPLEQEIDVAFPIMHGTNGEDGAIQGYFEMIGIPYVGCRIAAAAVGQDKVFMKNILRDSGISITDFTWCFKSDWEQNKDSFIEQTIATTGLPAIIKPASLGSSIGISKANTKEELYASIDDAFQYDVKVLVERCVNELVEVNATVLGDFEKAETAVLERVMGNGEFLDFKDKYQSNDGSKGAKGADTTSGSKGGASGMAATNRVIPADISEQQTKKITDLAFQTFKVLNSSGVCRIDFMIDGQTEAIYVNEINTIPGSLAFYLWQEAGVDFTMLTTRLIENAITFERRKQAMTFTFESTVLQNLGKSGSKGAKGQKM